MGIPNPPQVAFGRESVPRQIRRLARCSGWSVEVLTRSGVSNLVNSQPSNRRFVRTLNHLANANMKSALYLSGRALPLKYEGAQAVNCTRYDEAICERTPGS
jgi:hypothetical protein